MATLRPPLARLRDREFSRLARSGQTYLDYTGAALYPESLIRRHTSLLAATTLGNPHSENPSSRTTTAAIDAARDAALDYLDADPAEYTVCFTANASGAIRLVAESFPFGPGSRFIATADNHNSVNGIREFARRRGATVSYLSLDAELRLAAPLDVPTASPGAPSLFAFPAQSNFSGVRHPLGLVERAQHLGYRVLLDAAAFLPTSSLSLTATPADFVALSLYKMVGYPTGVGMLVARRDALRELERPSFAGGAVDFVSIAADTHQQSDAPAGFEDGTPNFLSITAVADGLDFMRQIGVEAIGEHVAELTDRLITGLRELTHPGGAPAIRLYGPDSVRARGGTVAFNLQDRHGRVVPHEVVVAAAAREGISLRGGCFCNPGAAEAAFGYDSALLSRCLDRTRQAFSLERLSACLGGAAVGAVRASPGLANDERDVDRLHHALAGLIAADPAHGLTTAAQGG